MSRLTSCASAEVRTTRATRRPIACFMAWIPTGERTFPFADYGRPFSAARPPEPGGARTADALAAKTSVDGAAAACAVRRTLVRGRGQGRPDGPFVERLDATHAGALRRGA